MVKLCLSEFELGANPIHETAPGPMSLPSTLPELVPNPSLQVLPIPRGDFPPLFLLRVIPGLRQGRSFNFPGHHRSLCEPRWPKGLVTVVGRGK